MSKKKIVCLGAGIVSAVTLAAVAIVRKCNKKKCKKKVCCTCNDEDKGDDDTVDTNVFTEETAKLLNL